MVSIPNALRSIKRDLESRLAQQTILEDARRLGCRWRQRVLNPAVTVQLLILQVLHGNACCAHTPRLARIKASASAYCQARMRLSIALLQTLLARVCEAGRRIDEPGGRWRGHRTFLIDGSSCSMPDTPALQEEFGQSSTQAKGCGFPVAHLLALFDAGTGMIVELLSAPLRVHDLSRAAELHPHLAPGDLLVGDRGFCSYAHLALLIQRKLHGVFRMHPRQIIDFTPRRPHVQHNAQRSRSKGKPRSAWIAALGHEDQWVRWSRPPTGSRWMSAEQYEALPNELIVRELRYRLRRLGFRTRCVTLATTLLDAQRYPKEALAELYASRWQVETNLRHLKQTLGMDVLHSRTVDGVRKEQLAFTLVYNLVRLVMLEQAKRHGVHPDRVSFIDALRWLRDPWDEHEARPPTINPSRRDRIEPRVQKRRPKHYPFMTKPRSKLRESLQNRLIRTN